MNPNELMHGLLEYTYKYRKELATTLLAMLVALFAYERWQRLHQNHVQSASLAYYQTISGENKPDIASLEQFIKKFTDTTYANMARMQLASAYYRNQQSHAAFNVLKQAIKNSRDPYLSTTLYLQLARLYYIDNKPQQSLTILQNISPSQQRSGLFYLLKADAQLALKSPDLPKTLKAWEQYVLNAPELKSSSLKLVQRELIAQRRINYAKIKPTT